MLPPVRPRGFRRRTSFPLALPVEGAWSLEMGQMGVLQVRAIVIRRGFFRGIKKKEGSQGRK